jgi:hypothetical protein
VSNQTRIGKGPRTGSIVAAFGADGAEGFHERLLQARGVPVGARGEADAAAQVVAGAADFAEQAGAALDHELVA